MSIAMLKKMYSITIEKTQIHMTVRS